MPNEQHRSDRKHVQKNKRIAIDVQYLTYSTGASQHTSRCFFSLLQILPQTPTSFLPHTHENNRIFSKRALLTSHCHYSLPISNQWMVEILRRQGGWTYRGGHELAGRREVGEDREDFSTISERWAPRPCDVRDSSERAISAAVRPPSCVAAYLVGARPVVALASASAAGI
jgi:hypothetical protein